MIKIYRPTSPGRRNSSVIDYKKVLTDKKPEKSLLAPLKKRAGRNSAGKITTRHQGGENKRMYRMVDLKQKKYGVPAVVKAIEYDPNRSAFIALIFFADGEKRYILASSQMKVGDKLEFGEKVEVREGNRMMVGNIPVGTHIHNLEMFPDKGGQIIRSAGSFGQVIAVEEKYALVKLPSTEVRKVHNTVFASIGRMSNESHMLVRIGKAGRARHMGLRPEVRGSAMNPVDHPHGGGEGRQPIGLKTPKTPWGKPAMGKRTRNRKKWSNKFIVSRRKKNK
jgi:large subunit ribosomal protein L2